MNHKLFRDFSHRLPRGKGGVVVPKNLCKLLLFLIAFNSSLQFSNNAQANTVSLGTPCINGLQVDINGGVDNGPTNLIWNWGDGQQAPGWFPQSHTYALAGQYTIEATAYYSGGATASASLTVQVGPGILSGNYSWTITAGQGGSISYQASVASGTVSPGESITLQQAYAVGGNLTAIPNQGYSFAGWSASSEIWFNYGSANTPSVGAVVDGNSTITANFTNPFAPIVFTGAVAVGANSAMLNGSVNPNGSATTAIFQWGTTAAYGSSIPLSPISVGSDTSTHNVYSPTLTGLNPNTTYHFRLFASSSGGVSYGADQAFTTAQIPLFNSNNLFVADSGSGNIYEFTTNGVRSTFVSGLDSPYGLAFNGAGDLFVSSWSGGGSVTEITPSGAQSIYASGLGYPIGLAFDSGGNLFVANAGGPNEPIGVAFDSMNDQFVSNLGNGTITEIALDGTQSTFASGLGSPLALAFNSAGNLFVGEYGSGYIYEFTPSGMKSTFASGVYECQGLAFNSAGDLFAGEYDLNQIIEITPNGAQSTFASGLAGPYGLAFPPSSPPTASPILSSLTITPTSTPADGSSQITATVTLLDGNDNPIAGKTVTFYASEVNANNTPVTGSFSVNALVNPTDTSGQATATITANTAGTVTIWAVDTTDSIVVQQTATAQFTPLAQVVPDAALSSAISDLDAASESNLGVLSTLAREVGSSGDYFWEQSQLSGVNLASDIAFSVVDFSGTVPDNIGDQLASIYMENAAPTVVDTGLQVINELNSGNNNNCSANNLFDSEWLTEMANNSLSPQAAAQGMLDHSQKLMASMWLQEQGQNVSISSLSDATVSSTLTSLYNSSDGLTQVASALPGCVTGTLNQDLSTRKSSLLSGIPPMSTAQQTVWSNDLAARQGVPLIYYNIISQYQQYLAAMTRLSESAQFGENAATLLQTFAGGWALVLDTASGNDSASVFVDSADDTVNTFADNARLNSYEQMYSTAFNTLEQCFDYNGRIWLNEAGPFAAIQKGLSPQTVTAQIGTVTNNSIGYAGGIENLLGWVETASYSDIPIQNTSGSQALFNVYVLYNHTEYITGLGWTTVPLISEASESLSAGQSDTLQIFYTQGQNGASPDGGSTVYIYILASNGSGTFDMGTTQIVWPANWLYESTSNVRLNAKSNPQSPIRLDGDSGSSSNGVPTIANPIAAYWTYSPSNQVYNVQLLIANPFNASLTAVVTQAIPTNIMILSTDGILDSSNSIITWTNDLLPYTNISANFSFTCDAPYGSSFTLPAAALLLEDTNSGATLNASDNTPQLVGLSTVQISGIIPIGAAGIDSQMQLAVTNLTSTNQTGSLTLSITDSSGNMVTNFSESFSLDGSDNTNLNFTLPGFLPIGSYFLTGSLSINGGTGQVLAGTYVVPAPPIVLAPVSTTTLTINGFGMALQGPAGNYLIEASPNLSSSTNWQPILYYSATNSSFYYYFTDPNATNYSKQFYRALMQ